MCFYLSLLKSPLVIHVTLLHFLHYHFTYVVHNLSDEKVTPKKYPMEMLIYTLIGTMHMAIILLSLAFFKKNWLSRTIWLYILIFWNIDLASSLFVNQGHPFQNKIGFFFLFEIVLVMELYKSLDLHIVKSRPSVWNTIFTLMRNLMRVKELRCYSSDLCKSAHNLNRKRGVS